MVTDICLWLLDVEKFRVFRFHFLGKNNPEQTREAALFFSCARFGYGEVAF
jgi:hypothetical protein